MLRTTLISTLAALALAASLAGAAAAAPAPSTSPVPVYLVDLLTRIYRGDDGSALYLRQQGNDIYGSGEHPGKHYAYVLKGKLVGDTISASWWDVPKGTRKQKGSIQLRWSQLGDRIVRAGGDDLDPDVFTAISPNGIRGRTGRRPASRRRSRPISTAPSSATTRAGTTSMRSAATSSAWPSVARNPRSGRAG